MPEELVTEVDKGNLGEEEAETETAEKSPSQKTETTDKTGEVEKTQKETKETEEETEETESQDDKDESELLKKNQPIPFERFKQFIDKRNLMKEELGGIKSLFENPVIFRAILQSKGVTDPKILNEKMRDAGFEVEEKEDDKKSLYKKVTEGLDLSKQESWFTAFERMFKELSRPIEEKLTDKEVNEWVGTQEAEAKKLAESFDIEYGKSGKDEKNINTAVGIMAKYLNEHPEDTGLGHVKILRLALSEKGFKLGKEQGKKDEKKRNEALRRSAMEDDTQVAREGTPNAGWSVHELMAWRRKQKG